MHEEKNQKRYNAVLKRVIMQKRQNNAKWKCAVMPFRQKFFKSHHFERRANAK